MSLLESRFLIPPEKQARLEGSWAHVFRNQVLPLIDEEAFRDGFDPENGRPNRSIRLLVTVHILKSWNDLTDEEVLENLDYNIQWHYAAGVTAAEAHLVQKTMHNFRVRLVENGKAMTVFDAITKGLVEMDGLSVRRQRLDSTHVMSDIAVLTRLGLFVATEEHFLKELKAKHPEKVSSLEKAVTQRYLDREGYFSDAKRDQAKRRLPVAARDLLYLVRMFERDGAVNTWESYRLMVRLLSEQCDITGSEVDGPENGSLEKVDLKDPKQVSGASLQSPHDPDATYGHKGKGYEAQVVETCVKDNPYDVVTHVEVNGANESDQQATVSIVEKLIEKGLAPEELVADTGFGSGENIVACAVEGVALMAPVHDPDAPERTDPRWDSAEEAIPPTPAEPSSESTNEEPVRPDASSDEVESCLVGAPPISDQETSDIADLSADPALSTPTGSSSAPAPQPIGLDAFRFNSTFNQVEACPAAHAPESQSVLDGNTPYKAIFGGDHCQGCPFADRCPTRVVAGTTDRVLYWRDVKAATATRQREQQERPFKEDYKIRSGVESTMEELKGRHGAGDLRVRRRSRVELAVILKAMAMNVKRAASYHVDRLREAMKVEEALTELV
jgi:hypothetical protein